MARSTAERSGKAAGRILIIEDEANAREGLHSLLAEDGFEVAEAEDGEEGLRKLQDFQPDAVLCDLRLPKLGGMQVLIRARDQGSDAVFVMMTAYAAIDGAVEAMRNGAESFLVKPFDVGAMLVVVEKAIEKRKLMSEAQLLRSRIGENPWVPSIVGQSAALQGVFDVVKRVAPTRATVLVLGESGTGKELVAQSIHDQSHRAGKPFVKVNCAALTESLLESELFGHEKGSFTGAVGRREGRFELANGGTLFLDEIGDISRGMQVKLLRVLQQQEFERVGGTQTVKVEVRVVAATNKDLEADVRAGKFREDLFYRLNVVSLTLPPLRERKTDIPALCSYFIEKYSLEHSKRITGIAPGTLNALVAYDWPGNVRELGNVVERAVVLARGELLTADDLPATLGPGPKPQSKTTGLIPGATMQEIERLAILRTLEMVGGSTVRAAETLGISVRKVQYRLKEYEAAANAAAAANQPPLPN